MLELLYLTPISTVTTQAVLQLQIQIRQPEEENNSRERKGKCCTSPGYHQLFQTF